MFDFGFDAALALLTLTAMEIVLGIDNIVFIAIVTGRLPVAQQPMARRLGLGLALVMRILLLFGIKAIMGATEPIFYLANFGIDLSKFIEDSHKFHEIDGVSIRDLILLFGGLFLLWKAVYEIHEKIEGHDPDKEAPKAVTFGGVLLQIMLLDLVFSLDSVITAVGMADDLWIMVAAVIIAVGVMMIFAEKVSAFVSRHPTVKMLALSFLILIGVMLVAEGSGTEIDKGYIYFAMFFALAVEMLNLRVRGTAKKKAAAAP